MSIVYQAIKNAVGQRGIANLLLPARDRQLRGQDRRTHLVAVRSGRDFNWIGAAIYEDEYVKVGDQWKFQTRTATAVHGV